MIESEQGDGVIIHGYFRPGSDDSETRIGIRYEADEAGVLDEEWVHRT
jgi:hypothetical protein